MEHTTFLQANGDLIGFLIFVVIPLALVMVLVIKNPQTALSLTLSLIKAVFKLLVGAGKFIAPFIMPFLAWVSDQGDKMDSYSAKPSSSDYSSSEKEPFITHDKTRWDYDHGIEKKYE